MEQNLLVFMTCPKAEDAATIVSTVVEEGLAACGNILPGMRSIYRWQGKVQEATEALVLLKTTGTRYEALERRLTQLHSYEVPEIIAVDIDRGLTTYLRWLGETPS
jgi:periplasmic divalent cation tolerance protein